MEETIFMIFEMVLIPILPILASTFIKYAKAAEREASERIKCDKMADYIDLATDVVLQAVQATTQTYVDNVKKQGKFGKEEHLIAFNKAKKTAQKILTQETKDALAIAYGDVDAWLDCKIEQAVSKNK